MCGLAGRAGVDLFGAADPDELIKRVWHRGPDGCGYHEAEGVLLCHTRLAIQDAYGSGSAQPFKRGHIVLTYNGEVWKPDALGISDRQTRGDTEVVAAVLEAEGVEGLGLLDGMWAVAWHDLETNLVHLARDRHGKVPLYYREDGGVVSWASEYGALEPGGSPTAVEPGQVVTIDPDTGAMWRSTYTIPMALEEPLEPSPEAVRAHLRAGVAERLVGDRPIAFMLSGGLDSTLILALAREHRRDIVAYTAVGDPGSRDLAAAGKVAAHFDIDLVEVPVPEITTARIREAVEVVEIPMKTQVEIALAHLPVIKAMASDGFAVCLSGEAADELFGGYGNMMIAASRCADDGYREIKANAVAKMARGNFSRVNKVGMRYGVECRLPFMQTDLVAMAVGATKDQSPPGKKLLKEAARGLVPDWVISRPKDTFQGATGTPFAASRALPGSPSIAYNRMARERFGHLPRS